MILEYFLHQLLSLRPNILLAYTAAKAKLGLLSACGSNLASNWPAE